MLQSNHFLDGSENWDTYWARKFLKIPQDQLYKIANIAEWSTPGICANTANKEVNIVTAEKEPLLQRSVLEKVSQSNSSEKSIVNQSNLQKTIGNKWINFSASTNKLLRSASLNYLNLFEKPSDYTKLRSANSTPNIKALINDLVSVGHTTSDFDLQALKVPELSTPKTSPIEELKDTFNSFSRFKDMDQISFSQPDMNYKSSSKNIHVEMLSDQILNHKYLKETSTVSAKDVDEEVPKKGMKTAFDSRMTLLDKRLSLRKECVVPIEGKSKQDNHLGITEGQKLSKRILHTDADLEMQKNVSDVGDTDYMLNEGQIVKDKTPQNSVKETEINISQGEKERKVPSERSQCLSQFTTSGDHREKSSVNHEESFLSQQIPCGQPVDADLSKKAKVEVLDKSIHIAPGIAENSDTGTKNSPLFEAKSSGVKRKRKSKSGTPKKLKDTQNLGVYFTAEQVKNMLEIMKMMHSEA